MIAVYALQIYLIPICALADICDSSGELAKYECAKAGDNFATLGEFDNAQKAWTISCQKGLSSSCNSLDELKNDPGKFRQKWASEPGHKEVKVEAQKKSLIEKCKTNEKEAPKCLKEAKGYMKSGDTDTGYDILDGMCDASNADACFELGGYFVRTRRNDRAVQPYLAACSLGNSNACIIVQQVQTSVKMKKDDADKEEDRQRQIVIEEKARRERVFRSLSNAFAPTTTNQNNKRRCTTSQVGNSLETNCQDSPY